MTYEELKKETYDFEPSDFWYWFLQTEEMDRDTKVDIINWFTEEQLENGSIVNYMKQRGVIQ